MTAQPNLGDRVRISDFFLGNCSKGKKYATMPIAVRFFRHVAATGNACECWLWSGDTARSGYGRFRVARKLLAAHRVSYEILVGDIPPGLQLDHLCEVRGCVNPWHLEPVTQAENIRRAQCGKVTPLDARTPTCRKGHVYDEANTYYIQKSEAAVTRRCRACQREAARGYYAGKIGPRIYRPVADLAGEGDR